MPASAGDETRVASYGPEARAVADAPGSYFAPRRPIAAGERIAALDVVRGVAVAGILVANVFVFFGDVYMPPERAALLPTARADAVARFLEHALIQGKFYSIFSLLFGIGFGLQLTRGGEEALPVFKRRLKILFAIGAIHAVFIWAGDILMLYALLGFLLIRHSRRSDRDLVKRAVILLAIPAALYVIAVPIWSAYARLGSIPDVGSAATAERVAGIFARVGTGGIGDAFVANLVFLAGRWGALFTTVRFPKVLGMFVLGLWTVRAGIALHPERHRATLVKWRNVGWGIGLPANFAAAWAALHWPYLPPSMGGLFGVVMEAIGFPMLAIGYACTIALLVVDGRRFIRAFEPVGRMALTNYLMHSVVCVSLSYGFGLGLWWKIGPARSVVIALALIAIQIPLSAWWLSRYRFGPVEWAWRRLTYRVPLPMRREVRA